MADGSKMELFQKWEVLRGVDDKQLKNIKFFHAFQTYTGNEKERKSSAMFVTTNDEVFAVGYNNEDNLLALNGNDFAKVTEVKKPRKIDELSGKSVRKITVSEKFGAAQTEDGRFLYWGCDMTHLQYDVRDKQYVKLPHEPREDIRIAEMACGAHSVTFVTRENKVLIWGCINLYYSVFYDFIEVKLRSSVEVKALATGWYHTALLDQKSEVWTFGYGTVGQLGYKPEGLDYLTPRKVPLKSYCTKVECGAYSTLFLLKNGDVYACGNNSQSDHLCVGKQGYVISPAKVLLDDSVADIAATYAWSSGKWQSLFAAASQDSPKYFKWGNDRKLDKPKTSEGDHSLLDVFANFKTPQSLGELVRVAVVELVLPGIEKISPGSLPNRSILGLWSIFGELDEDFEQNIDSFTVFDNSLENEHVLGAFIRTKTGDVYSWGYNSENARELGLSSDELVTKIPAKVESLSGKKIKKILFNSDGGIGLSSGGSLYVWGAKSQPKLENHLKGKFVTDIVCGKNFYVYLLKNSEVYLNGKVDHDFFPLASHQKIDIPGNEKAVVLSSGDFHFLVLTNASNVYAFGSSRYNQKGSSTAENNPNSPFLTVKINSEPCSKIMCGAYSSFVLTDRGELYAWGMYYTWFGNNWAGRGKRDVSGAKRIDFDSNVKDIAAAKIIESSGVVSNSFALKTSTGIYKLEDGDVKPKELDGAKFLVEAFEETAIPQSLSMVRLSPLRNGDDYDLSSGSPPEATPENDFFGDPLYSDVIIKLKDGIIPSHRVLLHIESAFFRKVLSSNDTVNREELDLTSYNPKAVRALLKWVYKVKIGVRASSMGDVLDYVKLAKEDGNPDLIDHARGIVFANMIYDNYLTAPTEQDKEYRKEMEDFIQSSIFP